MTTCRLAATRNRWNPGRTTSDEADGLACAAIQVSAISGDNFPLNRQMLRSVAHRHRSVPLKMAPWRRTIVVGIEYRRPH
jgi:hypothetical protein